MVASCWRCRVDDRPYWNEGRIYFDGINRMLKMQENIGNVKPPYDVEKVTDTRFLPDDLKEPVR